MNCGLRIADCGLICLALVAAPVAYGQEAAVVPVFPPADTNDYLESYVASCDPVQNATGYLWVLETNNPASAVCPVFCTASNSVTLVLASTNAYSILAVGATDGTNTVWTYKTCALGIVAAPMMYVTVSWLSAPATLQGSRDLINWTNISALPATNFASLTETNVTFYADPQGYFRAVPYQPLHIWKHY